MVVLCNLWVMVILLGEFHVGFETGGEALLHPLALGFPGDDSEVAGIRVSVEELEAGIGDEEIADVGVREVLHHSSPPEKFQ